MTTTKADFRLACARRVGLVVPVTTTAAGAADGSTFVAAGLIDQFPTDVTDKWVYRPGTSETRRIVAHDVPDSIAAVDRPFATQVADQTQLYVFKRFTPTEFDDALRDALNDVYPYLAQVIVDESLTLSQDTYEYTIPSAIRDLDRMMGGKVSLKVDTNVASYPYVEMRAWDTRRAITTASQSFKLVVHPSEHISGRTVRLEGLGPLAYPATDSDSIPLDAPELDLLVYMTLANLYAASQGAPYGDTGASGALEAKYRAMFEKEKDVKGLVLEPTQLKDNNRGVDLNLPIAYYATP